MSPTKHAPKKVIPQPHDAFTKAALGHRPVALALFEQYLPVAAKKRIDFATLELWQSQLVQEDLEKSATDMVYQAKLHPNDALKDGEKSAETCLCYIHCEQTTRAERGMPLRILRYKTNLLFQHLAQYPGSLLPPIFCLVIYNGQDPYPYESELIKLLAEPGLSSDLLLDPMRLIDLSSTQDKELMEDPWLCGFLGTLKHVQRPSLPDFMQRDLIPCFQGFEKSDGMPYIMSISHYIFDQGIFTSEEALRDLIDGRVSEKVEKAMMSLAENLRSEGLQKGRKEVALALLSDATLSVSHISRLLNIPVNRLTQWKKQADKDSTSS